MKVSKKGHTTVVKDTQEDLKSFVEKLAKEIKSFDNQNLVVDLIAYSELAATDINNFLEISSHFTAKKKSFVLVASVSNFDDVLEAIVVVPSLLEAHDLIEMDEIERDLGF